MRANRVGANHSTGVVAVSVSGNGGSRSGGGQATEAETRCGQGWPCLRQFAVFMENRVGRLHDLMRLFEGRDIRVVALSIANSVDCAFVRLMVSDADRAREALTHSKFPFSETDMLGVELPDGPQPFVQICLALLQAEVNVQYTYPLLFSRDGRGAIALYVDDMDLAQQVLEAKGVNLITESDLLDADDFAG